jgi:hypothetical protein
MGSMREARRAGMYPARSASAAIMAPNVAGSSARGNAECRRPVPLRTLDGVKGIDTPVTADSMHLCVRTGSIVPMGADVGYAAERPAGELRVYCQTACRRARLR